MVEEDLYELTEEDGKEEHPPGWKIGLKDHQLTLIKKCMYLENTGINPLDDRLLDMRFRTIKTNIGIIGDKVGSGKTYSILGLIACNPEPKVKFNYTMMFGQNNINVEFNDRTGCYDNTGLNLIVVPHSIIKQWDACIKNCYTADEYFVVNTTKTFEKMDDEKLNRKIMLVSGTFFRRVQMVIDEKDMRINRVIFDEVDSMNTPNCRHLLAKFYWFVSASYKNILNPYPRWNYEYRYNRRSWDHHQISSGITNNAFVKSIFAGFYKHPNQALKKIVQRLVVKNNDDYVERSFTLPEIKKQMIRCRNTEIINILSGVVPSNIIQCLNAGDINGAVSQVNNENVDSESNIIEAVIQGLHIKHNNIQVEIRSVNDTIYVNQEIKQKKIERLEAESERIQRKMALIRERIKDSEVCTICYDRPKVKSITKCCNNSFCLECIASWLKKSTMCPLCKHTIMMKDDIFIVHEDVKPEVEVGYPSKLQALQDKLAQITNDTKILIFSENDNSFLEIERILDSLNIRHARLKGNSINKNVEEYKNSSLQVLMVNSGAYGSGLNLENTTDVILFHKFDNDIEKQIIGRAQRPGRKEPLNVTYLLNENEFDVESNNDEN